MYIVAIAWLYVVVLMALAEGLAAGGSWLGAAITFVLYGSVPRIDRAVPGRHAVAARRAGAAPQASARGDPDGGGHAAGDAVAPVREEP